MQAATPFLADLVRAVDAGAMAPPALRIFVATGAAVPRALAERATRVLGTAVCGALGTTETCLGALAAPGDDPAKMWGTDGRALPGCGSAHRRRRRQRRSPPGAEGNFEVTGRCLFDGLPGPPGPDRGGVDRRRLVPHRRPGHDRRRRLPADHRAGQGRRSTAAARRSRSPRSSS